MYYACTGKDPFDGHTLIDLIVNMSIEEPEFPDDFPPLCRTLCERFMAKDIEDRPQNGEAAADSTSS